MFYQYMVNQPHAYYLRFFLNRNINVMVWNYRGYGLSKGKPNPTNIRTDGEKIVRFMRKDMALTGKIGVYGRSLGGVVTTHLVDSVDFIFADRTMSNFDILSNRKFYSSYAKYLFKAISGGWLINNELSIKGSKGSHSCYKVMMIEKADEVIDVHSSLMTGIGRDTLGRRNLKSGEHFYLSLQQMKSFITATLSIVNLEHDLFTLLDWAYEVKILSTQHSLMVPSPRFFCMGRGYTRSTS